MHFTPLVIGFPSKQLCLSHWNGITCVSNEVIPRIADFVWILSCIHIGILSHCSSFGIIVSSIWIWIPQVFCNIFSNPEILTVIHLLESKFCPGMSVSSAYLSSSSSSLLWFFSIWEFISSSPHWYFRELACSTNFPEANSFWRFWAFSVRSARSTLPSVQFSSVAQSCPALRDPMNRSTPGLPVHHQFLESTQTHVHWIDDAIQPSHPLLSPSPPVRNISQHQGLFQWVSSSHQVAKVLEFQLQHQSFQWTPRTDLL